MLFNSHPESSGCDRGTPKQHPYPPWNCYQHPTSQVTSCDFEVCKSHQPSETCRVGSCYCIAKRIPLDSNWLRRNRRFPGVTVFYPVRSPSRLPQAVVRKFRARRAKDPGAPSRDFRARSRLVGFLDLHRGLRGDPRDVGRDGRG